MNDLFAPAPLSNAPEMTVSDLAGALKRTLEDSFGRVRVRGELSKVAKPASGHLYTALKDDQAVIDAVCWKSQLPRLSVKPEEGMEVICTGRITTYPARSNYQLIIEQMELAGRGALLKMLEDRRQKLAAEGLFDPSRKRPLPLVPRTIGVITSKTGAVIQDILHRLSDRFPVHVVLWPVAVQGDNAAADVTRAIIGMNKIPASGGTVPRPDVIIVARGGGSFEDLMPFNDEHVVRAAANSDIPLISAVGHETDTTLIDYASDQRAPTPTAAAEMAVPVRDDLIYTTNTLSARLSAGLLRLIREYRLKLDKVSAPLSGADRMLSIPAQRLDHLHIRLQDLSLALLNTKKARFQECAARLRHPRQIVDEQQKILDLYAIALTRTALAQVKETDQRLSGLTRLLDSLSYTRVLSRGYAVVKTATDGRVITSASAIKPGENLSIQLADMTTISATTD
jgi:exodeoxyribonuclease VII large subunit